MALSIQQRQMNAFFLPLSYTNFPFLVKLTINLNIAGYENSVNARNKIKHIASYGKDGVRFKMVGNAFIVSHKPGYSQLSLAEYTISLCGWIALQFEEIVIPGQEVSFLASFAEEEQPAAKRFK